MIKSLSQPFYIRNTNLVSNQGSLKQSQYYFETLLETVNVVSFDLFDTLVWREKLFSPKDLFYQVEEEAHKKLELKLDDFRSLRVRAENIARNRAWGFGKEDVTLGEIYQELGRLLKLNTEVIQQLKEIELDCERSAIKVLKDGKQLFDAALAQEKKVVITTDTYFEEDFVQEIIASCGYSDASQVYISSVHRQTKAEGSLYELILEDLNCPPNQTLHVGDNRHSDVSLALKKGIRSFFVPTNKQLFKWRHSLGDVPSDDTFTSTLLCEIIQRYYNSSNQPQVQSCLKRIAVENLALLYFGYATWLLEKFQEQQYSRVYFAARDGLVVKRFFDLIADSQGIKIDSRYLYVSRTSLYPSLTYTDPVTAYSQFAQNWDHLTVNNALNRISLKFEDCYDLLTKYGLSDRDLAVDGSNQAQFSAFIEEAMPLIRSSNQERYDLMIEYLRQEGILIEEKAAFVDLGWHGSLQNCLLKLLNKLGFNKQLDGYYLGTFCQPKNAPSNFNSQAYFINNEEPQSINKMVRLAPSLLELFHSAGHATVIGYKCQEDKILPILGDNPVELRQFVETIEPIQNIAFNFIAEQLKKSSKVKIKAPSPELIASIALRIIYAPTAEEAEFLGGLQISSDFGASALMKSITGILEYDLSKVEGQILPDGKAPMWRPGFQILKQARSIHR